MEYTMFVTFYTSTIHVERCTGAPKYCYYSMLLIRSLTIPNILCQPTHQPWLIMAIEEMLNGMLFLPQFSQACHDLYNSEFLQKVIYQTFPYH